MKFCAVIPAQVGIHAIIVDSRQDHTTMIPTRLRNFRKQNLFHIFRISARGEVTVIKNPKGFYRYKPDVAVSPQFAEYRLDL